MGNHAILSASSSHRWMNCPPSVRLTEHMSDNGSVYATEGSEAHALCEYKLRQVLGQDAQNPLESPGGLQYYDNAMEDAVTGYAAFVLEELERRTAQAERDGKAAVAIDAISLIESGLGNWCDAVVGVLAPKELRIRRIMAREGISEDYAWARVRAQRPDQFFAEGCAHILYNDCGTAEEFSRKAEEFLKEIV